MRLAEPPGYMAVARLAKLILFFILDWGREGPNGGDVDGSGTVDVLDLVDVILAWGPCPA